MLEDIISKILGDKGESASDVNKKLCEMLESVSDENKKLRDRLEVKEKEVDSYKKMNVERREQYSNLRKLYNGVKIERNEYYNLYSKLLNKNNESERQYEDFMKKGNKTKVAQYLGKKVDSLQNELDVSKQMSDNDKKHMSDLELKNRILYRTNAYLKKRLEVYHSLHEGKNDAFNNVIATVNELEQAFRTTFEFTEPSLKGMAELFRKEKTKMEYMYADLKRTDKMFEKITKAQQRLEREKEEYETNKKMVEELYPEFSYLIKNKKSVLEQISNLKRWKEELKDNKLKDAYEMLKVQEFEYEQRKNRLLKNMALLKREEKWFHSELVGMDRQRDKMINENIEIQRKLYAEIEKNEQVLFIIRSLNRMNPLYEKITEELVASISNEKNRRIVSSFLKGESIYEIAQKEGKSATSVQRIFLLAINALRKIKAQG